MVDPHDGRRRVRSALLYGFGVVPLLTSAIAQHQTYNCYSCECLLNGAVVPADLPYVLGPDIRWSISVAVLRYMRTLGHILEAVRADDHELSKLL